MNPLSVFSYSSRLLRKLVSNLQKLPQQPKLENKAKKPMRHRIRTLSRTSGQNPQDLNHLTESSISLLYHPSAILLAIGYIIGHCFHHVGLVSTGIHVRREIGRRQDYRRIIVLRRITPWWEWVLDWECGPGWDWRRGAGRHRHSKNR